MKKYTLLLFILLYSHLTAFADIDKYSFVEVIFKWRRNIERTFKLLKKDYKDVTVNSARFHVFLKWKSQTDPFPINRLIYKEWATLISARNNLMSGEAAFDILLKNKGVVWESLLNEKVLKKHYQKSKNRKIYKRDYIIDNVFSRNSLPQGDSLIMAMHIDSNDHYLPHNKIARQNIIEWSGYIHRIWKTYGIDGEVRWNHLDVTKVKEGLKRRLQTNDYTRGLYLSYARSLDSLGTSVPCRDIYLTLSKVTEYYVSQDSNIIKSYGQRREPRIEKPDFYYAILEASFDDNNVKNQPDYATFNEIMYENKRQFSRDFYLSGRSLSKDTINIAQLKTNFIRILETNKVATPYILSTLIEIPFADEQVPANEVMSVIRLNVNKLEYPTLYKIWTENKLKMPSATIFIQSLMNSKIDKTD